MERPRQPLIRLAHLDELETLLALQQRSLRQLGAGNYAEDMLEAALAHMGTMDPRMIADGTYLVAEIEGMPAGCAGWTARPLPYARLLRGSYPPLPAACGKAGAVRSLYVAPEAARQGVGRALLHEVEARLVAAGKDTAELVVALSGEAFFLANGYIALSKHAFQLAAGMEFEMVRMIRVLRSSRGSGEMPCPAATEAG